MGSRVFNCLAPGAGCLGAESMGAAATDAGLLVCAFRRNTSAPPVRQAPTTHGVQLVSPSRRSGRLSAEIAAVSFGEILADVPSPAGGGGGCEMIPWMLEAAREVVLLALPFGRQRRHARLPVLLDP